MQYGGGGHRFMKLFHKIPLFFERWLPFWVLQHLTMVHSGELSTKVIVLSWSTQRKSSCFRGALNKSHHDPAFVELPMKYTLLLQQSCDNQEFPRLLKNKVFVAKICKYALFESFDGLFCGHQEPANPSYPVSHRRPICISTQPLDWFAILWNGNPFDLQSF